MKRFIILLSVTLLLGLIPAQTQACEIEIKVKDNKATVTPGSTVVLQIKVFLTHRECPEGIKATKFNGVGLKLTGATKWKQTGELEYVRLVKAQIDSATVGEAGLQVTRSCDKEGGLGSINLKVL